MTAGERGARLVLYAGEPISEPLVHHGPFVAGSRAEVAELYQRFRTGQFSSMSQLARQHQQREEQGRSA
jgi:redox-sensitive bicupin YhaK (pirin superfamily)